MRRRTFEELSVDELMREAGLGRTLFYRHFDDLGDLLLRAGREAITELFEAQQALGLPQAADAPSAIRQALEPAVGVYARHGPLLRAITEAAATDERIAEGYLANRRRFDVLVEDALRAMGPLSRVPLADAGETARALNLLNEHYLLDAFGREPRVSAPTALQTLTEIWFALLHRRQAPA